jgi:hypothetical protein
MRQLEVSGRGVGWAPRVSLAQATNDANNLIGRG